MARTSWLRRAVTAFRNSLATGTERPAANYDPMVQLTPERRPIVAVAWGACATATGILVLSYPSLQYSVICVASITIQLALCLVLWLSVRRLLSICTLMIASWSLYFTVRMIAIMYFTDPVFDHQSVVTAPLEIRADVWVWTTAGLLALTFGMMLARRLAKPSVLIDPPKNVDTILRIVALGGIVAYAISSRLAISSGLFGNVFQLYIFALAALTYRMAQRRRVVPFDVLLMVLAVALGSFVGFKEPAVVAILAGLVGYLASDRRVRVPVLLAGAVVGMLVFSGVQAQRIAFDQTGTSSSPLALPGKVAEGLTQYDLARGVPSERSSLEVILNPVNGVLGRIRAPDALFALNARVPSQISFQGGRTITEPILVTLPFMSSVIDSEFTQLSLGRYYNINFWSYRPELDSSSQGISVPGDLFLNWGWPGVVVGLALLGGLVGWLDRRFPARSALGAGLFAYALLPLISLERNLAYQLFTVALRLVLALVFMRLLGGTRQKTIDLRTDNSSELMPVGSRD